MGITTPTPLGTISAAQWGQKVVDDLTRLDALAPIVTDYSATFALTAATTSPTKGSSVYTARYVQTGKMVNVAFKVAIGAGFVAGSGAYKFSLPVAAHSSAISLATGVAFINASGVAVRFGIVTLADVNNLQVNYWDNTASLKQLDSAGPGRAWTANDYVQGSLTYEAA